MRLGKYGFGLIGIQKCKTFLPTSFFGFGDAIMNLQIILKYQIFFFLMSYQKEFQPLK